MRAILGLILAGLAIVLNTSPLFAAPPSRVWMCDGKFGLCRYIERDSNQEIIPPRYERGMPFSEGLAAVRIAGRYGYIDERGETVIEPRFDLAGDFTHGLAEIVLDGKAGAINRKGEIVVPPMFRRAIPLTSEVVVTTEGKWISQQYPGMERLDGLTFGGGGPGNVGLYHITGHWVHRPDLREVQLFDEGRGLVWASNNSGLYGLLASTGEWVIEPTYDHVQRLVNGRAIVITRVDRVQRVGAVDETGKLVVPLLPRGLSYWANGWGISGLNGKEALVDRDGNIIGGRYFDKVERAETGDVAKVLIDGHWKGIDRAGNIVDNPGNGRVIADCPNGFKATAIDGKMLITDASGKPTSPHLFEPFSSTPACDRPLPIKLNDLYSFVALDGRLLFDPPVFKDVYGFDGGYAVVRVDNKWGVIDTSGRFVIPMEFDKYLEHRDGLYHLAKDNRDIWLSTTGEEQRAPRPIARDPSRILECQDGTKLYDHDRLWGMKNADDSNVIAPRYRALSCFKNGIAWAAIDEQRQWCAIGPDGTLREYPSCTISYDPIIISHLRPEQLDSDRYESSVLWVRAYLEFGAGHRDRPPRFVGDGVRAHGEFDAPY